MNSSPLDTDAPSSKLLLSNSTTTTTLASNHANKDNSDDNKNPTVSIKLDDIKVDPIDKPTNNNNGQSELPGQSTHFLKNNNSNQSVEGGDGDKTDEQDVIITKKESNVVVSLKLLAIFSTLYFFMWSSSILSQAFNLTSYHHAGHFIRTSGFLQNPLIGLMVGVITTVVFQSSGAVTSVLVTIVGSGVLSVRQSIPIIMGANLGTSVTNTVVSLFVYRKKQNFEIAMTAGIVHDMYNMMSVVFMLPLELLLHPLEYSAIWMVNLFGTNSRTEVGELQFLSYLVKPLVDVVILIDKEATNNLDPNTIVPSDVSLVKKCCNSERYGNTTICHKKCFSLFSNINLSDNVICILLLIIAMMTLYTSLVFVVKVTKSLLG